MRRSEWLVHQLPVGMVEDEFLARFVRMLQAVSDTVLHRVDTLGHMFDPAVAPPTLVRTLGRWIGVEWIDESQPDDVQRRIVREYAQILQWRGTRRGVEHLLELITGGPATVADTGGVHPEGHAPRVPPHVRLEVASTGWATEADLIDIVRSELPAWVTFELVVGGQPVWPPLARLDAPGSVMERTP